MKRLPITLLALSLATCHTEPAFSGESPGGASEADVIFNTAFCNENYDSVVFITAPAAVNTHFSGYLPHIIRAARLTGCNEYNKALRSNRSTGAFSPQIGRALNKGKSRITGNSCFVQELNKNNRLLIIHSENLLEVVAGGGYSGVLSQNYSVTPQRHCGIFMPVIRQNGGIAPLWWDDTAKYNTLYGEHAWRFCNTESESRRPNASQALATYSTKLQALQK